MLGRQVGWSAVKKTNGEYDDQAHRDNTCEPAGSSVGDIVFFRTATTPGTPVCAGRKTAAVRVKPRRSRSLTTVTLYIGRCIGRGMAVQG